MAHRIRRASPADLDQLAALFDAYRVWYRQPSDRTSAHTFLAARLERGESVVLVGEDGGVLGGFTQLYPSFSSVGLGRVWVLNDLFVEDSSRRSGLARALLAAAIDFARADGALRLELETAPDNAAARSLYEATGWRRADGMLRYAYALAT